MGRSSKIAWSVTQSLISYCFMQRLFSRLSGVRAGWLISSSSRGPSCQVFALCEGSRFIALHLRRPIFMGMPTGPEAFLEPADASGLWPFARTHLKKGLVPHSSAWWDVRQISLDQSLASHVFSVLTGIRAGLSMLYERLESESPWLRLGNLWVGELHHWHFCHLCISLYLAVQFKL